MKKITVLFVSLVPFLSGCLSGVTYRLDYPVVAGIGKAPARIEIMNNTMYEADIFILDRYICRIHPGESIYDRELVPFEGQPEPIAVLLYERRGKAENYVGCAVKIFRLYSGRKNFWDISYSDIHWYPGKKRGTPPPKPGMKEFPVKQDLPHIWKRGTKVVQIINNTPNEVKICTGSRKSGKIPIPPGNLYVMVFQQFYYETEQTLHMQIKYFKKEDKKRVFVGDKFFTIRTSTTPEAEQIILE